MTEIPLFPLSSVLVPHGAMPLQIFEQRYLDMVASCMRTGTGFGMVWLRKGSEVSGGSIDTPDIGDYGTYARITDFDQLPNGLLGITIRGEQCFHVEEVWREDSGLVRAPVNMEPVTTGDYENRMAFTCGCAYTGVPSAYSMDEPDH